MFEHVIEVGDGDIDMLGHASNIAFLRWIQDSAILHSTAMGLTFEAYRRLGAFFVVRRHEVDYLRPALRGESLRLRTWLESAAAAKCERMTEIVRVAPANGGSSEIVAKARTTWGFVEATTGRPTRIPDDIRIAFGFAPRKSTTPPPPAAINTARQGSPIASGE
jgi:acyl-CoA thioester hydrolase